MTLGEILGKVEEFDDELTIYAEGGPGAALSSPAAVAREPEDGSVPPGAEGMQYLLEVALAVEVLEVWRQWRDGRQPSIEEGHQAITYYAANDAYIPA